MHAEGVMVERLEAEVSKLQADAEWQRHQIGYLTNESKERAAEYEGLQARNASLQANIAAEVATQLSRHFRAMSGSPHHLFVAIHGNHDTGCDSLLTATVSRPIDPDKWAILNVISLLLPSMFPKHEAVGHVMPETRAEEYWPAQSELKAPMVPQLALYLVAVQCEQGEMAQLSLRRKYSVEYKAHQRIPAMDYRCDHINPQLKLVVTTTDPEGANVMGLSKSDANLNACSTEESVSDIHVLQREEHCRYLGIQVGQTPSNASNWSKCIQALRVRLRLARLKTHSVAQRAAIASAVIIPKVLYVARHSWPSTAIVNQLHDLVKQFVWGSRNGKPAKPWMKEEQAELKKMNGGLSVPNIRTELMTMSATAVSKWTITTSHIDQAIGEILLHNTRASSTYITPLDAIPRRPLQLRDNMWTTGAALCASLHSRPYEPRERDNVRWCYEHFKSTIVQTHWDGDVFQIDLSSKMSDRLPGIIAEGRKLRGTFCAEWLPYMTSTADGWLLDSNGSPYKLAHTSLSVGTAQLGDILRWEWIRPGVLNFIPTCGISGFSRPSIRALERLCATLVSNFPQLLYRPQQANVLRLYNGQRHYNHEWHLHTSEATLTHVDTTLVKATHTVHSATDCDVMPTRDLNGQKVSFHAHPRFTRIVQLWGGNGRYNTTRSFYRQQVAATRTQIGKDTRDAAVNKAVHTAGSLWPGLQLIQWSELHNIPGITAYTVQTLLRLKANRLSMWNYEKADLSCSNPECSQVVQSSVQHLLWECPKARLVWNYFYALWAKIGITPGHDPEIWIFSLDLPDTPRHAWTTIKRHIIGHKFSNEHLQDHLYPVAHMLWRYMSASLIHAIWCAHLRRMDSDPIKSTAEMAIMMTRLEAGMRNLTRLAEAQAGDSDGHTVAAVLKAYVDCFLSQTDAIPLTPNDTRGVYLLFFDGGSRGNPGPGGTGSIIVRVHKDSHTASLIWTASMANSRKDTTNNFAEYWGLIHGLREAQRSHFEPLYVIGDSALIISQQRMHRSPRQHRLARLYQTSRRLADCIDIRGWYHHYRAFNKMADSAANLAMDTRTSTQVHFPTQRAAFNNLTQDLDNDVMHWLMRSSEDPRIKTDDSGSLDIVLLQETHVLETEVASMQSRFRRSWGFQEPSEESDPRLSLWSASTERKGGVAILLNPYSCIPTLAPYKQDQWNAHWMAATVTLRGETVLLLNIYAPSTVFAREAFYRALSGLLSSHDGPILCGGDFNCTLNQMADRSHNNHNKVHDSRELKKLLQKLNLVDTLEDDALRATDTRDVKAFHRQHHTYYYTLPSDGSASSRLDRWYCSNDHLDWVRSVYQSVAGPFSDHNGVTIRVAAPDKVIQSKKPRVVYPLPKNAAAHATSIGKDFFEKAHDQLDELRGRYSSPRDYALATANWWDEAKIALRIRYLEAKKSYFARLNQGYKKKIQRLQRRLSESEAQMLDHSGGAVGDQNVELSQEFLTTATSIRRAIAECKSKWQASRRDRIFREHMHHERKTSKSFYKHISTKFLDNTIFTLGGTATCGPMRSRELADDMGEGWKSIMQQTPTLQTDIDQILDPGTAIPPSDRLGFLLKPIDSSEIKQAVKKCKRGKAHGPDELGNDWYRDHCDEITGLFERLFNLWIPECVLPSSFSEAHIHCIKKSVSAASPLDYRPIALLNSDYKIFTRIFATRLRTVLPWLIHHMQAGFVPGRAIPTTIDVLLAAQQRATSDPAMSRAIALLLDFAKAYDSIDRSFLAQALQHLGFPLKFVHLVKVLHSQTTYKFIVNGFLSRKYNVTSGIRQGCPLVPLLFILALEVLYRKIEESDEIHGVELQAAGCATEVRLGGYADDTTIYLSDPKDINAVFAILDKYGAASGLRVNRHKSAVLPLNKEYSSTEESVSDIHVLQREEHCRYLGIQVGQTPSNASNWSKCIQALRVRLRLARLKTHSVAQRAAIASAVIIPKVLYVARHSWPSTAIVNQLHDLVKQFVWGSRNGKPAKPWMKEEQAELKKMNGGLSVPNIRTELMTMSATAVSKWAITTSHIDQVIGEILLHNTRASSTYITPLDAIPRRPLQLRDNMWTTGAALCASLHSRPYEPRERDNVRWCYEHFKSTIVQTQWDGDVFQIDLSSKMSDRLPGIIAEGRKLRGTFCAEWLPYMTSTADGWLLDSNGSPYKLAHTSLSVGTAQLGDILRWEWIRPGVLNFIPTCGISGFSRPSIRALERLCATLVSNFPQLLYRPQQTNVLRLYNGQRHYNHEWHLHTSEATLTHVDTTLVKATHTVHSAMDCDIMPTRDLNGQKVSFHAHPRFTRIVSSLSRRTHAVAIYERVAHTAIWCAHLRRMDSDPIESTAEMAVMMTRLEAGMRNLARLAEVQAGDSDGHTVAAVLKAYVDCFLSQTDAIPLTPNDTRGVYLLFFDGGSRGNPGPGGTGSIIVRVHKDSHTASLIWTASMANSRKDTTNNFAEYWGLIHGLREAQRSHFEPLYVIGDSALIISQQRMHRSPRQHRLARLYQTSRRLADCIDIRGWYHHYRAFNKMADSAANLAMDTRTSTQVHFPTHRAAFNNLTQDLDNDVMHWLMRSSEDPRSLDNTRQPHIGPREHAILVKDYLAFRSDLLQSAL
ncbi:reverse transcriptase, partial [Globisporangium splendens]